MECLPLPLPGLTDNEKGDSSSYWSRYYIMPEKRLKFSNFSRQIIVSTVPATPTRATTRIMSTFNILLISFKAGAEAC